jgi:hypothetical protein
LDEDELFETDDFGEEEEASEEVGVGVDIGAKDAEEEGRRLKQGFGVVGSCRVEIDRRLPNPSSISSTSPSSSASLSSFVSWC